MSYLWAKPKSLRDVAEELASRFPELDENYRFVGASNLGREAGCSGCSGDANSSQLQVGQLYGRSSQSLPKPIWQQEPALGSANVGDAEAQPSWPWPSEFGDEKTAFASNDGKSPPANDNRTDQETCDHANANCVANARRSANSSEAYLKWREQCNNAYKPCSTTANSAYRFQREEFEFLNTGVVIFKQGQPAIFVPYGQIPTP